MANPTPTCACPRCGYDLSGAVDSWSEQCPVEGVCSECGLKFEWRDILSPIFLLPAWSFEHSINKHLARLVRSWSMSLRPRRLWKSLRLHHPIRTRRLLIMTAIPWIIMFGLCSLSAAVTQWEISKLGAIWSGTTPKVNGEVLALQAALWPWCVAESYYSELRLADGWIQMAFVWAMVLPLTMMLVPDTLKRCKVRLVHTVRIGAYALSAFAIATTILMCIRLIPLMDIVYSIGGGNWGYSLMASNVITVLLGRGGFITFIVCGILLSVSWTFAIKRYLRLEQPFLVAITQLAIAFLLALVLVGSVRHGPFADIARLIAHGPQR